MANLVRPERSQERANHSLHEIRGPDASFPQQNQDASDNGNKIEQENGRPEL